MRLLRILTVALLVGAVVGYLLWGENHLSQFAYHVSP